MIKKEKKEKISLKEESGLGQTLSPFNLFSFLLEWKIMDATNPDLSYVPIEYIEYLAKASQTPDEQGSINHIIMLFCEHLQLSQTGNRKVFLDKEKYYKLSKQFSIVCELEILRRKGIITVLDIHYLFDPNIKTEIKISTTVPIDEKVKTKVEAEGITLKILNP